HLTVIRHTHLSTVFSSFFFIPTPPTYIYTLSLHDALPIYLIRPVAGGNEGDPPRPARPRFSAHACNREPDGGRKEEESPSAHARSEEHTSELQSSCNLVCRLLLEKKKKKKDTVNHYVTNIY